MLIISGSLSVAFFYGRQESQKRLEMKFNVPLSSPGIQKVKESMEKQDISDKISKREKFDKRITGSHDIDDLLQSVLELISSDYIKYWYREVSDDDLFLTEIHQCFQKVFITFSQRSKEVDWMPYFTQRLVDDFASHIRLYIQAMEKSAVASKDERAPLLEQYFFDLEVKMEKDICRNLVSLSPQDERQYLQDLCDVLLFLLLPTADYNNKPFRYILRAVLVNSIFLSTIDLLSDPDYVNSYIAWMCKEGSFNNDTFMTVIKTTDSIAELESVIEFLDCDIAKWRSQDTGGNDDAVIKQNLNSLIFVKTLCEDKKSRLQQGIYDTEFAPDVPGYCRSSPMFILTLDDIISNNIALTAFIEFMMTVDGVHFIYFYLNVEGFRTAAETELLASNHKKQNSDPSIPQQALESMRKAAMIIHDQYLSDKAKARVKIEPDILKRCLVKIKSKSMPVDVFDEVQARVYQMLHGEQYYEAFIKSTAYVKLLDELGFNDKSVNTNSVGLDDDLSMKSEETTDNTSLDSSDNISTNNRSSRSSSPYSINNPNEFSVTAQISNTGIVQESEKTGKSYAVFAIRVTKKFINIKGEEDEEIWDVYRRYSDFHDLQMIMSEKLINFHGPSLPPKTVFRVLQDDQFLEKRKKALDNYLQTLLNPQLWEQYRGAREFVMKFLAPGMWAKHKSDLARKVDSLVNPFKAVGHAVISVPDNKNGESLGMKGSSHLTGTKVSAGLDPELDENIPLRIMLLLMDEVFDLQHKNQWLRRQIVRALKQVIKSILGDSMNKKIVEHVDSMTSAEQVAEYIKTFRESYWPEGKLAEPRPAREHNTKMRTRVVCKSKMLGSIPDDLRRFLGTETVRVGMTRVFDMFQYPSLNRRLVYVVLEGVIETLFPQNKFKELFRKLHSQSERLKAINTKAESSVDPASKQ